MVEVKRERERETRAPTRFFIVAERDTRNQYLRYHINSTVDTNYNVVYINASVLHTYSIVQDIL